MTICFSAGLLMGIELVGQNSLRTFSRHKLIASWHPSQVSVYSTTPPTSILPRLIFSPFERRMSSTVRSLPFSVLSLNQPRWSAIKCLFLQFGHWTRTIPFSYACFVNSCVDRSQQFSTVQVNVIDSLGSIFSALRGCEDVSDGAAEDAAVVCVLLHGLAEFELVAYLFKKLPWRTAGRIGSRIARLRVKVIIP